MNAKLYVETLSQKLLKIADLFCYPWLHLSTGHMAKLAQDCIATNCSEFIGKDEWPPNSPDLNPLDYHVRGARPMFERYKSFQPKPENIDELKKVLQLI